MSNSWNLTTRNSWSWTPSLFISNLRLDRSLLYTLTNTWSSTSLRPLTNSIIIISLLQHRFRDERTTVRLRSWKVMHTYWIFLWFKRFHDFFLHRGNILKIWKFLFVSFFDFFLILVICSVSRNLWRRFFLWSQIITTRWTRSGVPSLNFGFSLNSSLLFIGIWSIVFYWMLFRMERASISSLITHKRGILFPTALGKSRRVSLSSLSFSSLVWRSELFDREEIRRKTHRWSWSRSSPQSIC